MRIKPVFRPEDYAGNPAEIAPLFDALFPGIADPGFDANHAGLAIAAHNPALAQQLASLSRILILDTYWSRRADLREIAIQVANLHFGCRYGFETRVPAGETAGLPRNLQQALLSPDLALDANQRLVADYAAATLSGTVPDALFDRAVAAFGDKAVVELGAIVGFWGFWAMFLNATRPGA